MQEEVDTSMYETPAGNAETSLSTGSLFIEFVLFHKFISKLQILDIMIPHMMRRKEKQARTICMESLKVASQQNMTKRNGKT